MPSDDDLRRVAEDVRTLARSLSRELRDAVNHGRRRPGRNHASMREDLRRVAEQYRYDPWGQPAGFLPPDPGPPPSPAAQPGYDPAGSAAPNPAGSPAPDPAGSPAAGGHRHTAPPGPWWAGPNRPGSPYPTWGSAATPGPWAGYDRRDALAPWTSHGSSTGRTTTGEWTPPPAPGPAPARERRARRRGGRTDLPLRHRRDGSTILGLLAVVAGLAWLLPAAGLLSVSGETAVAAVLMLLGAAMVLTARTDWSLSRRSWPVWLGVALIAFLVMSSGPVGLGHGVPIQPIPAGGTRAWTTWASLPPEISGPIGHTKVDLSQLPSTPPQDHSLSVVGSFGEIDVTTPANIKVNVDVQADAGAVFENGNRVSSGFNAADSHTMNAGCPSTLNLHIRIRAGVVRIETPPAPVGCQV